MSFIPFEYFHDHLATDGVTYEGDLSAGWNQFLQEEQLVLYLLLKCVSWRCKVS